MSKNPKGMWYGKSNEARIADALEHIAERSWYGMTDEGIECLWKVFEQRMMDKYVLVERGSNEDYERWKRTMVLDRTPK